MTNVSKKTILDVKLGDVVAKYSKDKVILVGTYSDKDSNYVENVEIIINPGRGGAALTTKTTYSGYNFSLFLGDFNGDGKDEIMVSGEYGGSGGYAIAAIYDLNRGRLIEIFNPDKFSTKYIVTAKYLDKYRVLVNSETLKQYFEYDISNRQKVYLDMIYDKKGKVNKGQEPSVSAVNGAYPIMMPYKKLYYLFLRQRLIGVNNADTIGYVESFVSLEKNNIEVIQMGYYNYGQNI